MSGLFKSKKTTVSQEPLLTPEQRQAMDALNRLGQTGSFGGINLGEAYQGSLGDFDMTDTESLAGSKLYDLLNAGTPEGIETARRTLTDLATPKFNPDDPSSGFAAYQRQLARTNQSALDTLNRDAAITGDRFSSSLGRQKVDLAERQSDLLASKLAELFDTAQNRSLSAASGLVGLEGANENIAQSRIGQGFQLGGLERLLKTAEAEAKYNEYQRQRAEKLTQIDALKGVAGANVNFGVPSQTIKTPSPFTNLLNAGLTAAGYAFGGPIGGMIAGGIGSIFNRPSPASAGGGSAL